MTNLYLVSVPIGNSDDITLRALKILKNTSVLVCEDFKIGRRIIKEYELGDKELLLLNEHSNQSDIINLLDNYLLKGVDIALFSDAGTPVFADPGYGLVKSSYSFGINVVPIVGASSLMGAIAKSDILLKKFYFYGFLSAKKEIRAKELLSLKSFKEPIILLEAPYRLSSLLEALKNDFDEKRYINVITNITMKNESIVKGSIKSVWDYFQKNPFKGEFVVIIDSK
ncbi:16S rRNA (cytidine(1402)-2'-O)-methyltransferase [bacterium]|nr:16S rRNA (cytidine(1402)-2'-O)-methyltransferase [bacterium]